MTAQLLTKSPTNILIIFGETVDLILSLQIKGLRRVRKKPWKEAAATDEELAISLYINRNAAQTHMIGRWPNYIYRKNFYDNIHIYTIQLGNCLNLNFMMSCPKNLKSLINGFNERGSDRFTSLPIYLPSGDFICREGRSPSRLPVEEERKKQVRITPS